MVFQDPFRRCTRASPPERLSRNPVENSERLGSGGPSPKGWGHNHAEVSIGAARAAGQFCEER